jgi:lipopolysaccharide/colanic/teichoic acid biosynthesis glycosyltransferase
VIKRALDIVASAGGLVLLAPVMVGVALAVRLSLGSPILFRQARPGLHGRPFVLLKFRTMRQADDLAGNVLPDKDRLTRLGRFLRSTSLDELPSLWNVLRGEMSLVGPRPLLMEYLPLYNTDQLRRHDVRPGITGLVQVSGRNALTWNEKFDLDLQYVEERSLWLDLKIIGITLRKVVSREGVSQPGRATMDRFRGNDG